MTTKIEIHESGNAERSCCAAPPVRSEETVERCCAPAKLESCCAPEEKGACCLPAAGRCGCN